MNETKRTYKHHIQGLKGFACFMVMLGHFIGIYKYAEAFPVSNKYIDAFLDSKLSFLVNESFWLYLFFVTSGYLLAFSKIKNLKHFLYKSATRFLRLGIPIIFAYLIIYFGFYLTIGFRNNETVDLFYNSWYQSDQSLVYNLFDVVLSPFDVLIFNNCTLNSPYWVLREMFFASIIIYFISYIRNRFEKFKLHISLLCVIAIPVLFVFSRIIASCLFGMIVCWYEDRLGEIINNKFFAVVAMAGMFYMYIAQRTFIAVVAFSAVIIFVPKTGIINRLFSSKLFGYIGKISFGIYSFHWPIYLSCGALIIKYFGNSILLGIVLAIVICIFLTISVSWLYNISFEKFSFYLIRKLDKLVLNKDK